MSGARTAAAALVGAALQRSAKRADALQNSMKTRKRRLGFTQFWPALFSVLYFSSVVGSAVFDDVRLRCSVRIRQSLGRRFPQRGDGYCSYAEPTTSDFLLLAVR